MSGFHSITDTDENHDMSNLNISLNISLDTHDPSTYYAHKLSFTAVNGINLFLLFPSIFLSLFLSMFPSHPSLPSLTSLLPLSPRVKEIQGTTGVHIVLDPQSEDVADALSTFDLRLPLSDSSHKVTPLIITG